MDNPWQGPSSDELPKGPSAPDTGDPVKVASETLADLFANPVGYFLANLAYFGMLFGVVTFSIAVLGLSVAPGIALEDETLTAVGGIFGFAVYTLAIFAVTLFLHPMMTASLMLAMREQRRGGETIGFSSAYNRMWDRMGPVVRLYLLTQLIVFVGMLFLYIPGLIAAAVGMFAFPIVVFEEVGAREAFGLAWKHVSRHGSWHLVVWLLLFVLLIAAEFSIIGLFVFWPLMVCYQLIAYEKAFGSAGARALYGE